MTTSSLALTNLIQFYMKLEEKMHAKEVEMNQIQARTQVHFLLVIFCFVSCKYLRIIGG